MSKSIRPDDECSGDFAVIGLFSARLRRTSPDKKKTGMRPGCHFNGTARKSKENNTGSPISVVPHLMACAREQNISNIAKICPTRATLPANRQGPFGRMGSAPLFRGTVSNILVLKAKVEHLHRWRPFFRRISYARWNFSNLERSKSFRVRRARGLRTWDAFRVRSTNVTRRPR